MRLPYSVGAQPTLLEDPVHRIIVRPQPARLPPGKGQSKHFLHQVIHLGQVVSGVGGVNQSNGHHLPFLAFIPFYAIIYSTNSKVS